MDATWLTVSVSSVDPLAASGMWPTWAVRPRPFSYLIRDREVPRGADRREPHGTVR